MITLLILNINKFAYTLRPLITFIFLSIYLYLSIYPMKKKQVQLKLSKSFINNQIKIKPLPIKVPNTFYILSCGTGFISKKQFESCLRIISYHIKKARKYFYTRLEFNQPITKKPRFSRMGSGKGRIRKYVAKVHMNSILFVFRNISYNKVLKAFRVIKYRFPIKITLK